MSQSATILETKQLSKSFGSIVALENASIRFEKNKIYGLFGRNGAGKTTLLDILSNRIFADKGSVTCYGEDVAQRHVAQRPSLISENCCYMPEKHYFPGRLKVKKLLAHAQGTFPKYNAAYAQRLCRLFELNVDQKYDELSRGYQSIFRIVLGLAANAAITIFDEPVLGLDAVARDMFYQELIEEFSRQPRLFIIATHLIEESADLFNEAIILKDGRVLRQAPVDEMLANVFYVSGQSAPVDAFIQDRMVISSQAVNGMKTAVIEGNLSTEKRQPGLSFAALTMQKLFIYLTHDEHEWEEVR